LGQEAASKAVNAAKVKMAQAERDGEIGFAEARRVQTIQVAAANAEARRGENAAQATIADSDSERRAREAAALQIAETAELVARAETERNSYNARRDAENARAEVESASQFANIVVPAQIEQQRALVEADASAESKRRTAAGANPSLAINLLLVEQLPLIVERQTEAIKNLKIDKITVWENGGKDGAGAGFVQSLIGALPPLHALAKQAGLDLPEYLGTIKPESPVIDSSRPQV
jgi:flotillin